MLASYRLSDEIGQLSYKVWYFVALKYDEDQRDNEMNARRQQVQILFAKFAQVSAWFSPELLAIPLPTVQQWMAQNPELAVYRFAIEDLYRQQEHVLDEKGEHLLLTLLDAATFQGRSPPVRRSNSGGLEASRTLRSQESQA